MDQFHPDFQAECRVCGRSPCVLVIGHKKPETELCSWHFFGDLAKLNWTDWNNDQDD